MDPLVHTAVPTIVSTDATPVSGSMNDWGLPLASSRLAGRLLSIAIDGLNAWSSTFPAHR